MTEPATKPNDMPDVIWVSEYDTCLLFETEDDANTIAGKGINTQYFRAEAIQNEMAPVKGEIVKLNCKIVEIEIVLEHARRAMASAYHSEKEEYLTQCDKAIDLIDKILGENK